MVLTNIAKEKALTDADLFGRLCKITGKKPNSVLRMLYRNESDTLARVDVANEIAKFLNVEQSEVLEPQLQPA